MAETITKQLWSEFNGKGFEAESAKYAERASCDAMDNDLTLTITNSKVNAIGGCNIAAETAIKDSEGNLFKTAYAKKSELPDISGKQDTVTFADGYDATTNPAATVATVNNAVSSLVSCDVSYNAQTGELHLDFSGNN